MSNADYCDRQADSCRDSAFAEERGYEKIWRDRAAELRRAVPTGWQPIETAPRYGEILGWRNDSGVMLIYWSAPMHFLPEMLDVDYGEAWEQEGWFCNGSHGACRLDEDTTPTLWQPLPHPPAG